MVKPTDKEKLKKLKKKRGFYFHNAVHMPLSKKYGIKEGVIDVIRKYAIHKKMSQAEICINIHINIQDGNYKKLTVKDRTNREKALTFLLRCTPEVFEDITRKTKMDWD